MSACICQKTSQSWIQGASSSKGSGARGIVSKNPIASQAECIGLEARPLNFAEFTWANIDEIYNDFYGEGHVNGKAIQWCLCLSTYM